jgi:fucose permease
VTEGLRTLRIAGVDPRTRLFTIRVAYAMFIASGWNQVLVPSLIRPLEHDLSVSDAGVGIMYFLTSVLFSGAAAGGGVLTERLGRRTVMAGGTALAALGLLLAAAAPSWLVFVGGNILTAIGIGMIDAQISALCLDLYPEAPASAMNKLHGFFGVGSLVGPLVVGLLVTAGMSWRLVIALSALMLFVLVPPLLVAGIPSGKVVPPEEREEVDDQERSLWPFIWLALGLGLYTAAEVGVNNWVVRYLSAVPLAEATAVLSGFWVGLTVGRFGAQRVAERMSYSTFAIACIILASVSLAAAILCPIFLLAAALFFLAGVFYGPIYPTIMTLGGQFYPHRIATLTGALSTAAGVGVVVYPPLMGILASRVGLGAGMMGAALLGVPMAIGIYAARRATA